MVNDPQNATGRSRPAQCPIAPMASAELPANVFASSMPSSEPSSIAPAAPPPSVPNDPGPPMALAPPIAASGPPTSACAPAIGLTASRAMIAIPSAPAAPSGEPHANSDEERTLLALLRLLDRVIGPGTISPVERVFVAGAKIMFDQLSKECRELLKRKPSDLTRSMAPSGLLAYSAGNSSYPEPVPASAIPDVAKKPKKSKSKPTANT